MKFTVDKSEQYAIFQLGDGKLLQTNCARVKTEVLVLHSEGYKNLIFDATNLTEIDPDGAEVLLVCHRLCLEDGGIFIFVSRDEKVESLLKVAHLQDTLNILPTVEEAIDAVFLSEIEAQLKLDEPGDA
jgi:anti-anti-sigma regulatory factor